MSARVAPVLTIAGTSLRRLIRDRGNLFFVFVLPLLLVLLIGVQFGGSLQPRLLVDLPADAGDLGRDLVERIRGADVFTVELADGDDDVTAAVRDGRAAAGLTVPDGYDATLRAGRPAEVGYVARPDGTGALLRAAVEAAVAEHAAEVGAAHLAAERQGLSFDAARSRAGLVAAALPAAEVIVTRVGEPELGDVEDLGRFDVGASSQLLLFVFLTSLAGSAALIQSRQWGVSRRMLATPTSATQILLGEGLGRFAVALVQALYIVLGTAVVFGVRWGDPPAAAAVITAFSAVSAGAAMLMGSLFDNDAQAGGVGVLLGLGLAALGGSMLPLELFSDTMRRVAHLVTPHAWANDAFAELVRRDGTVTDILPELGVLTAVGVVLLWVASWRLHRVLTRTS